MLQIQIQSGSQLEKITVSDEGVELLMPGTPQQTVETARDFFTSALMALLKSKKQVLSDRWAEQNITIQS